MTGHDAFLALTGTLEARLSDWHVPPGGRVWLAVSGGADSVALLRAAAGTTQWSFGVLHVDHGLRPTSEGDRKWVAEAAARHGFEFRYLSLQGLSESAERKAWGMEAAARAARYSWFSEVAGPDGVVLTAHHADDQRETRLLHLLRGSRPESLMGMLPWHTDFGFQLGRPFLGLERSTLMAAISRAHANWREDESNADPAFLRNRIRHELIPLLDSIRPGWEAGLSRWGRLASDWSHHLSGVLEGLPTERLPLSTIEQAPSPEHLIMLWGGPLGFGAAAAPALLQLAHATTEVGRMRASASHVVIREREALVARPSTATSERLPQYWLPNERISTGRLTTPDGTLDWRLTPADGPPNIDGSALTAQLEWCRLAPPFCLRPWREGDRIAPLGMEGSQLISDVLTQRKVPSADRAAQWVVEQEDGRIAWLVGHRIARDAALVRTESESASAHPRKVLVLTWEPRR